MKKAYLIIGAIICIFVLVNLKSLLSDPYVWSDEAIFANTFRNFISTKKMGTTLWPMAPGFESTTLYYPPVYFLIHVLVFKFVPLTIVNMRLISLTSGTIFLMLFALTLMHTSRDGRRHVWLLILVLLGLATDDTFNKMVKFSRPEIFLLLFWIVSMFLLIKGLQENMSSKLYKLNQLLCGLFIGLAFLTHYIGIYIFFSIILWAISINSNLITKFKKLFLIVTGFVLSTIPWVIYILANKNLFVVQMQLIQQAKSNNPLTWELFLFEISPNKFVSIGYLILSTSIFVFMFKKKTPNILLAGILLFLSWAVTILGNNLTYYVIPVSMMYFGIYILLTSIQHKSHFKQAIIALLAIITLFNLNSISQKYTSLRKNSDYDQFTGKILELIPDNKTVLLSVVPDPYFKFVSENRNNRLIEHPVPISDLTAYQDVLNQTDYVILNNIYNEKVYGQWLQENLKQRQHNVYLVRVGAYSAYVYELTSQSL